MFSCLKERIIGISTVPASAQATPKAWLGKQTGKMAWNFWGRSSFLTNDLIRLTTWGVLVSSLKCNWETFDNNHDTEMTPFKTWYISTSVLSHATKDLAKEGSALYHDKIEVLPNSLASDAPSSPCEVQMVKWTEEQQRIVIIHVSVQGYLQVTLLLLPLNVKFTWLIEPTNSSSNNRRLLFLHFHDPAYKKWMKKLTHLTTSDKVWRCYLVAFLN